MRTFKVKINQAGNGRTINVIARSSIDALLSVMRALNVHEPVRVFVRPA